MYICRHCGLEYKTDEAVICTRCQAPKGKGGNFCPFCGTQVTPEQKICMNCGVEMENYGCNSGKSKIAAGLLGIFLGTFGVHNFYLGYTKRAVVQLMSVIATYIYLFVFVFVAGTSGDYVSDATGAVLVLIPLLFMLIVIGVRIWSFVEAILILCGKIERDGKGRSLK